MDSQTGQGGQHKKAAGSDDCQSVRCDSESSGNSRQPNRRTGGKPPREGVECDANLSVHKTVNNSCSIQSNFLRCFYTDYVFNKRSELLSVIESEGPDIICITETLPKNQGGMIDPAELQFQDFDCFHNLWQKQCHTSVTLWVRKR